MQLSPYAETVHNRTRIRIPRRPHVTSEIYAENFPLSTHELQSHSLGRLPTSETGMPIPTKPPVYNGMIAPRDSWMMPPPCNEMIPPGAPRILAERVFHLTWFRVKPF